MAYSFNNPGATGWAGASAMSFNPQPAGPHPTSIPPMGPIVTPWNGPPATSWSAPQPRTPLPLFDVNGNLFPRLFARPTPQSAMDMEYTPFDVETAFLLGQSRTKPARQAWLQANRHYLAPHYYQLPAEGTLRIKMSQQATVAEQNFRRTALDPKPIIPRFWALRFDNMVTPGEQATIRAWYDRIVQLGSVAHNTDTEGTRHVFSRPTYHFGRWKRQGNPPLITRDTCQPGTRDAAMLLEQQKAIFTLIALVGRLLYDRVRPKLNQYDSPVLLRMSQGASMASEITENNYRLLPDAMSFAARVSSNPFPLRFGGICTSMAATTGQSDQLHLDMDDGDYTVVLPMCHHQDGGFGDWGLPLHHQWGQLELPQLGYRIPVRPGQALLFRANHLLHAATPLPVNVMDNRLSLTVFNCTYLQRTAIGAWENPWTRSMARARTAVRSLARAIRGG